MKKSKILANAIAMVLASASMGANAQSTTYVGNLPNHYALPVANGTSPLYTWDGHNNGAGGFGWGWGHTAQWITFDLATPTAINIAMTSTTVGAAQANFNSAFTLWSTAGYTDPGTPGHDLNGHTFSQVSTDSTAGGGTIPWLTDPANGGVTGIVGYANSGPTGWINAAGLTVGSGTELNGSTLVNTVTVGSHNAALLTKILPAGHYLMVYGGNKACGTFLSNTLAACPANGNGTFSLTIDQVVTPIIPVREDNDGDQHADILWHNTTDPTYAGFSYEFLMDSSAPNTPTPPLTLFGEFAGPQIPVAYAIKGRGDYNGDGLSDILWGNSANQLYVALRSTPAGAYTIPTAPINPACTPATSVVVGTGDYDGDHKSDILLQNTSGDVSVLLMNGTTIQNSATCATSFATHPGSSIVRGTGDYNGDGKADILWRDSAGTANVQLTGVTGLTAITGISTYDVQGTGDYNGDKTDDILLRDASGNIALKDGTTIATAGPGTPILFGGSALIPTDWQVRGTGDYDGDGKHDILWRNYGTAAPYSGSNFIFLMNGSTVLPASNFVPAPYGNIPLSSGWDIAYTQTQ